MVRHLHKVFIVAVVLNVCTTPAKQSQQGHLDEKNILVKWNIFVEKL